MYSYVMIWVASFGNVCQIRGLFVNHYLSMKASAVFRTPHVLLNGSTAELQGCNNRPASCCSDNRLHVLLPFAAVKRGVIRAKGLPFDLCTTVCARRQFCFHLAPFFFLFFWIHNGAAASNCSGQMQNWRKSTSLWASLCGSYLFPVAVSLFVTGGCW